MSSPAPPDLENTYLCYIRYHLHYFYDKQFHVYDSSFITILRHYLHTYDTLYGAALPVSSESRTPEIIHFILF